MIPTKMHCVRIGSSTLAAQTNTIFYDEFMLPSEDTFPADELPPEDFLNRFSRRRKQGADEFPPQR